MLAECDKLRAVLASTDAKLAAAEARAEDAEAELQDTQVHRASMQCVITRNMM